MVRKAAASALGRLEDKAVLDKLLVMAQSDRKEVKRSAAWALSKVARVSHLSTDDVLKLKNFFLPQIEHADHYDPVLIRCACPGIAALAISGHAKVHSCLPYLRSLLDHSNADVCSSAAYGISMLAEIADLPLVQFMSRHSDGRVRAQAASAIGRLKHTGSTNLLIEMLADRDTRVSKASNWALYQLPNRDIVEETLINMVKAGDEQTSMALMRALIRGKRESLKEAIQKRALTLLDSTQKDIRAFASFVCRQYPNTRAIERCIAILRDPERGGHATAGADLAKLSDAIEPCLRLLNDPDPGVRASACGVLAKVQVPRAAESCLRLLNDPDPGVRGKCMQRFGKGSRASRRRTLPQALER